MTAIRNVGELASPYFLLEVWARREEIDIDPETYASLKRRARSLVRDARAFELRGEEPDDDWRQRRLELLALNDLDRRAVKLEGGTEAVIGVWRDGKGQDAVVIGDLAGFTDPDQRTEDEADPASTRFELALDAYDDQADWGVLLAGLEIRIYRRSSGISQQYLALDLDTLVELDDEPAWKAFAAMFRAPAFAADRDDVPLIRRVVDESRRHASALAADMRRDVVDAAEAIIQGVLDHPGNAEAIGEPTRSRLHELFEESLYVLYRVLFVLYAESRDVLPLSGLGPYATSYSLDHLVELARHGGARLDGRYFHDTLSTLFELLWDGPTETARRLGFEPVGGELFDPKRTPTLGRCTIPDTAWERALASIALGAPDSPRSKLGRRSSFAELGVDQLGSIYEGLLVLEPYLAAEPAYLGIYKAERRVFPDADVDRFNIIRRLAPGDFVLESAGGRRKGTGSFYTPHEITEYLSHAAIDPLLEPILERAPDDPDAAARELLDLKVCDPAMGSGAFLVQAARVLALALARIRATRTDGLVTPDRVHRAKREVVRHCLYGVDLNPLAVALAKVSLWLETLEPGRPLSFLDAHLRCGDSLVGVNFVTDSGQFTAGELSAFPANAHKGLETYLRDEGGDRAKPVLARLKSRKAPRAAHQATLPGIDRSAIEAALEQLAVDRERISQMEEGAETLFDTLHAKEAFEAIEDASDSIRNRLRRAADFWCAQWFSDGEDAVVDDIGPVVPASVSDFEDILAKLVMGERCSERLQPHVAAAEAAAERRRFFHWALEFPEVFFERGGFDAVMGNPPWNETNLSEGEYFGTFDASFPQLPPEARLVRKAELRSQWDIDHGWRSEVRWLSELANYVKPNVGRYFWFAGDGQLRKGDANVFRLFIERAYVLLRPGGRLTQVLPDSFYISSPATGVRANLIEHGAIERCWVFENGKHLFPIESRLKIVLLVATRDDGPTVAFSASFLVGKDRRGQSKSVSLEELPQLLTELSGSSPMMTVDLIRRMSPETLAFPELNDPALMDLTQSMALRHPALGESWDLRFCRELDAKGEKWDYLSPESRDKEAASGETLLPVLGGESIYNLEYPAANWTPSRWIRFEEIAGISSRVRPDGSCFVEYPRVAWRKIGRATDERSLVASVLPPMCAAKNTCLTIEGGHLSMSESAVLAGLFSSLCFDFLYRVKGSSNATYAVIRSIPSPSYTELAEDLEEPTTELLLAQPAFASVANDSNRDFQRLDAWEVGIRRAIIDARVALAYDLSLEEFALMLLFFPNLDLSQPMLPSEPKCFVTRDFALKAFCDISGSRVRDMAKLLRNIGSDLPDPRPEYCDLDARINGYRELGAVPYRPTPKGARVPTDPSLIEDVLAALSDEPLSTEEVAEALGEPEEVVTKILRNLKKSGEVYIEGRGKSARYYVVGD